jgi:hypothetical protein
MTTAPALTTHSMSPYYSPSVCSETPLTLLAPNYSEPEHRTQLTFDFPYLLTSSVLPSVVPRGPLCPPTAVQTDRSVILCHAPLPAVDALDRDRLWLCGLPPCRPSSPLPITSSSSHVARLTVALLSAQSRASSISTKFLYARQPRATIYPPKSPTRHTSLRPVPRSTATAGDGRPSLCSAHSRATGD